LDKLLLNHLSENECLNECKKAKTDLKNAFKDNDIAILDEYSNKFFGEYIFSYCEDFCGLFEENEEIDDDNEDELIKLRKRDMICEPINQANIVLINENYKYGIPLYQNVEGSVRTSASEVNGCGPKTDNTISKIVNNYLLGQKAKEEAELFRPACNAHDVCYSCSYSEYERNECDNNMLSNMEFICRQKFSNDADFRDKTLLEAVKYMIKNFQGNLISEVLLNLIKKRELQDGTDCLYWAEIFKEAVKFGGEKAFNKKEFDPSENCAACGYPLIYERYNYNTLYYKPFYMKECCYPKEEEEEKKEEQCEYKGLKGVCKDVKDCNGNNFSQPGLCSGGKDNQCCLPITPCKKDDGEDAVVGQCLPEDRCRSGNTISGRCPGGENVLCCLDTEPNSNVGDNSQPSNNNQYEIIDVSEFNVINDYTAVVQNIQGVIIRCGYRGYGKAGNLVSDKRFTEHYNGFKGKTKIGYYFLSQAITTNEAIEEADYVVNHLIDGKQNDFPIYLDSEWSNDNHNGRADSLSKKDRTDCIIAFMDRIKALNYKVGVYASEYWFNDNLDFSRITATGASIWVANYRNDKPSISNYDMWQYTKDGTISGINEGKVDRSHVYKNIAGW